MMFFAFLLPYYLILNAAKIAAIEYLTTALAIEEKEWNSILDGIRCKVYADDTPVNIQLMRTRRSTFEERIFYSFANRTVEVYVGPPGCNFGLLRFTIKTKEDGWLTDLYMNTAVRHHELEKWKRAWHWRVQVSRMHRWVGHLLRSLWPQ